MQLCLVSCCGYGYHCVDVRQVNSWEQYFNSFQEKEEKLMCLCDSSLLLFALKPVSILGPIVTGLTKPYFTVIWEREMVCLPTRQR